MWVEGTFIPTLAESCSDAELTAEFTRRALEAIRDRRVAIEARLTELQKEEDELRLTIEVLKRFEKHD